MSVLARPLRRLAPSTLAMLALAFAACATAEDPQGDDDDGPNLPPAGGSAGTAGSSASTAGSVSSAGTGGKPANATGGSGGQPTTTGGQPTTTGGQPTTAGGATTTAGTTGAGGTPTTGTCPPYTGTRGTDSVIFKNGFGASTTGTWSGYGYTYKYGTATVTPGMGNSCFAGAKFCASGSVPAADTSGAGLGWNIGQMMNATATTKVPVKTAVKVSFAGVTAGMRVQLSADSMTSYCYTLTAAEATAGTATIPYASFVNGCWDATTGTPYDGTVPIEAIQIAVPGSTAAAAATAFDFCVLDIEPG